jgi:hypothetical protein
MKNKAIGILIIGIVGAVAILFMNGFGNSSKAVAIVNGEKISSKEYEEFKNKVVNRQRIDITAFDEDTKKQFESSMLDGLISQKVLDQSIKNANITIEDSEVETKFTEVKTQIGGEEQFKSLLVSENLSEKDLKNQIKQGMMQEKYFAQNIDLSTIVVTDEEVKTAFEEFSKGQEIGTFDENKENLKNYLLEQKKQDLIVNFVDSLRKSATVEILI